jgi:hypothetical protein
MANFATGTAGVVDSGGNLPQASTTPVINNWKIYQTELYYSKLSKQNN